MMQGSFDLQVNGYLGIDFSSPDLTEESCAEAFSAYTQTGADRFLPTIITNTPEVYEKNLRIMSSVLQRDCFKNKVVGIHAEGPFLSREPGAIGAHNPDFVHAPEIDYFNKLQEWAQGSIKLLTIAAEVPGADAFCAKVSKQGVAVSLGHQLASYDDLDRLYDNGASLITHLGNGMPNEVHRHHNTFLAGLAHPGLTAMIIADGHHLPGYLVKMILKAKGLDKVIVTSDAAPLAGLKPGAYTTLGNEVVLEESGLLHNPTVGCLVGSSFSLDRCIDFMKTLGICDADIEQVCVRNPAKVLECC